MARTCFSPFPQKLMTNDSLPFNLGVLAFQLLAPHIIVRSHGVHRRLQNRHFHVTKEPITNVGEKACHSWKQYDLCTPRKFARGFFAAIPRVSVHFKPVLKNGFRHQMPPQRLEATHCRTNVAWIRWVVVCLDRDPVLRDPVRSQNNLPQRCSVMFVGNLGGAAVKMKVIVVLFCDRHFHTE
jgi:hypothetical protein